MILSLNSKDPRDQEVIGELTMFAYAKKQKLKYEKLEAEYREKLLLRLGGVGSIQTEKLILVISNMSRRDLDRERLREYLGNEFDKFLEQKTFLKVEIKEIA
jgi:hypothetical protein